MMTKTVTSASVMEGIDSELANAEAPEDWHILKAPEW